MLSKPQAPSSLEEFPTEIWLTIFRAISDVPTLRALALTNSALHKIFIKNTPSIFLAAVSNHIPAAILPEAIAAWSSSKIKPWSKLRVRAFLQEYHANREAQLSQPWKPSETQEIIKLSQHCRFFSSEFSAAVLSTNPISGSSTPSLPPSRLELNRIERAFYRFELYCNLFRKQFPSQQSGQRFHENEKREMYFEHYAAWENEQLACVYEYLLRRISIPFNDLISHDRKWGKCNVGMCHDYYAPGQCRKKYILSSGLSFLQTLVSAQTYEERRQLLNPYQVHDDEFLYETLNTFRSESMPPQELKSADKPFFQDNDTGPEETWRCVHRHWHRCRQHRLYFDTRMKHLRTCGFCCWDYARLRSWGVFGNGPNDPKIWCITNYNHSSPQD